MLLRISRGRRSRLAAFLAGLLIVSAPGFDSFAAAARIAGRWEGTAAGAPQAVSLSLASAPAALVVGLRASGLAHVAAPLAPAVSLPAAAATEAGSVSIAPLDAAETPSANQDIADLLARSYAIYTLQPSARPSDAMSLEGGIKLGLLLEKLRSEPRKIWVEEARNNLRAVEELLQHPDEKVSWNDLHEEAGRKRLLDRLAPRLTPIPESASADAALDAMLRELHPPLERRDENPWETVFREIRSAAGPGERRLAAPWRRLVRSVFQPRWREAALGIMIEGSMRVSRTAAVGRKYLADQGLSHDDVKDRASANFAAAARYVVDHAEAMSLNHETAIHLNKMLTEGLVPASIHGRPYHQGDARFHEEVRLFYDWLTSPSGRAMARTHPIELAEQVHYLLSFFDVMPDSDGRTARLMADLVLLKAGLPPAFYTSIDDYFARGSVRSSTTPRQRLAYFREAVERGRQALGAYVHRKRDPNPGAHAPTEQEVPSAFGQGHESISVEQSAEPRGSAVEYVRRLRETPALREGAAVPPSLLRAAWNGFGAMPASFKQFLAGGSLIFGASVGIAITMSVYGIRQFGVLPGILAQGIGLVMRIVGGKCGAALLRGRGIDAKKLYLVTTALQGLQVLALPAGLALFGAASPAYLAVFVVGQVLYGLIYGATNGMAESEIMPRLVSPKDLVTAGFLWTAGRMACSLAVAFVVHPLLHAFLGDGNALYVYAGMILAALPFFARMRLAKAQDQTPQEQNQPAAAPAARNLATTDCLPVIAAAALNMGFYTLFNGVFADYSFPGQEMNHKAVSWLVLGSCLVSLAGAAGKLGRAAGAPPNGFERLLNRFSPRAWYAAATLAGIAFLLSGAWAWPGLYLASVALLGVTMAMTGTLWTAHYQARLNPDAVGPTAARLSALSVAATLPPFLAISVAKYLGAGMAPLLTAVAGFGAAALAAGWLAVARAKRTESSNGG